MLYRSPGRLSRWHGRIVATNPSGKQSHWPTHSARSRHDLVAKLWEEATLDIRWRTGDGTIELVEVEP